MFFQPLEQFEYTCIFRTDLTSSMDTIGDSSMFLSSRYLSFCSFISFGILGGSDGDDGSDIFGPGGGSDEDDDESDGGPTGGFGGGTSDFPGSRSGPLGIPLDHWSEFSECVNLPSHAAIYTIADYVTYYCIIDPFDELTLVYNRIFKNDSTRLSFEDAFIINYSIENPYSLFDYDFENINTIIESDNYFTNRVQDESIMKNYSQREQYESIVHTQGTSWGVDFSDPLTDHRQWTTQNMAEYKVGSKEHLEFIKRMVSEYPRFRKKASQAIGISNKRAHTRILKRDYLFRVQRCRFFPFMSGVNLKRTTRSRAAVSLYHSNNIYENPYRFYVLNIHAGQVAALRGKTFNFYYEMEGLLGPVNHYVHSQSLAMDKVDISYTSVSYRAKIFSSKFEDAAKYLRFLIVGPKESDEGFSYACKLDVCMFVGKPPLIEESMHNFHGNLLFTRVDESSIYITELLHNHYSSSSSANRVSAMRLGYALFQLWHSDHEEETTQVYIATISEMIPVPIDMMEKPLEKSFGVRQLEDQEVFFWVDASLYRKYREYLPSKGDEGTDHSFVADEITRIVCLTNVELTYSLLLGVSYFTFFLGTFKTSLSRSTANVLLLSTVRFVRNILIEQVGQRSEKFLPMSVSVFLFILSANLIGLIPGCFCITSQLFITFSLSFTMFIGITIYGFRKQGFSFLQPFVPKNVPMISLPSSVGIEVVSYISRTFSLAIRLFANMVAGHALLHILMDASLKTFFSIKNVFFLSVSVIPISLLLMAIIFLEFGIAFPQAYVFVTPLSIYLNDSLSISKH